jgi:hypothetical protein
MKAQLERLRSYELQAVGQPPMEEPHMVLCGAHISIEVAWQVLSGIFIISNLSSSFDDKDVYIYISHINKIRIQKRKDKKERVSIFILTFQCQEKKICMCYII